MNVYNPLISIITIVYNGEKYLEETINSVLNQTYKNIEYIIIDIIKKYEHKLNRSITEEDIDIYDIINKGISKIDGKFIEIINITLYFIENFETDLITKMNVIYYKNIQVNLSNLIYKKYSLDTIVLLICL